MLRYDDTSPVTQSTKTISLLTKTTYIMEFAFAGSTLIGYLKDSGGTILSNITVTDSTYSSGNVGFDANTKNITTVTCDDLKIEKSI